MLILPPQGIKLIVIKCNLSLQFSLELQKEIELLKVKRCLSILSLLLSVNSIARCVVQAREA